MNAPRKGKSTVKKAVSRPAPRAPRVNRAAPTRLDPKGEEVAAAPGDAVEDPMVDVEKPDLERPGYGAETEQGRHILELLEKHQDDDDLPPPRRGKPPAVRRFEIVEHTADVGIKAFGDDLCEAFENAALGMFNIITDPSKVGAPKDFEVTIEGDDLKSRLHEWLSQLLILSQVNGLLFGGFKVEIRPLQSGMGLTGQAIGEPADPAKHVFRTEIKAVTHHMLEVRERPPMVKVLFDI